MLKELLRNTKFLSDVKLFFKENEEEIIDIILFGSVVKGKERPHDIDILVLYKTKENLSLNYKLKKQLQKFGLRIEIISKTYKDLFSPAFLAREAFLSEGYSLIMRKFISQGLGYSNLVLFRYDLKGFSKSKRMRFYYSLYGRGKKEKGMLDALKAYKFSERILISPVENSEKMKEYLDSWEIPYTEMPILIPTRIIKSAVFKS